MQGPDSFGPTTFSSYDTRGVGKQPCAACFGFFELAEAKKARSLVEEGAAHHFYGFCVCGRCVRHAGGRRSYGRRKNYHTCLSLRKAKQKQGTLLTGSAHAIGGRLHATENVPAKTSTEGRICAYLQCRSYPRHKTRYKQRQRIERQVNNIQPDSSPRVDWVGRQLSYAQRNKCQHVCHETRYPLKKHISETNMERTMGALLFKRKDGPSTSMDAHLLQMML